MCQPTPPSDEGGGEGHPEDPSDISGIAFTPSVSLDLGMYLSVLCTLRCFASAVWWVGIRSGCRVLAPPSLYLARSHSAADTSVH